MSTPTPSNKKDTVGTKSMKREYDLGENASTKRKKLCTISIMSRNRTLRAPSLSDMSSSSDTSSSDASPPDDKSKKVTKLLSSVDTLTTKSLTKEKIPSPEKVTEEKKLTQDASESAEKIPEVVQNQ